MKPRWSCIAALLAGIVLLASAPFFISGTHRNLALLERLTLKIERAQALAPDSRETIERLVEVVRQSAGDERYDLRRHAAIERVTAALKAKDTAHEMSSVGQRGPAR
jgi:hypothetical protein